MAYLGVQSLHYVVPADICKFLVQKDMKRKTQIHELQCPNMGQACVCDCGCPKRLAAGNVQSLVRQMKAIFECFGNGKTWDESLCSGNPATSIKLRKYLKAIQQDNACARVKSGRAKPLFFNKLGQIFVHIDSSLKGGDLGTSQRFIFLRDQASFKV